MGFQGQGQSTFGQQIHSRHYQVCRGPKAKNPLQNPWNLGKAGYKRKERTVVRQILNFWDYVIAFSNLLKQRSPHIHSEAIMMIKFKTENTKYSPGYRATGNIFYRWWEYKLIKPFWGKKKAFIVCIPYDPTTEYIPNRNEQLWLPKACRITFIADL